MNPTDLTVSLEGTPPVKTDEGFNKNRQEHEASYTTILSAYSTDLEDTLTKKRQYKSVVFWLSFALLCLFPLLLIVVLFFSNRYEDLYKACLAIIPTLISFLTVFIVIPKVITEYLFNSEEEKYMSDIIKNIQDYDINCK